MNGPASASPTIEIIVNTDGSTSVQTHGFHGNACRTASAFLERALGVATDERLTSEFYQQATTTEHEREAS